MRNVQRDNYLNLVLFNFTSQIVFLLVSCILGPSM